MTSDEVIGTVFEFIEFVKLIKCICNFVQSFHKFTHKRRLKLWVVTEFDFGKIECSHVGILMRLKVVVILTICFSVIIGYIFYDTDFFIHIFMAFNGDYGTPNAGSGFGMILSYSLNGIALLCSILIGIYNILTNRQQ